jgi:ubiquinone/menaquinone biosynthesis C-methylase UbiE
MDEEWQMVFEANAQRDIPDYQKSCWTQESFEEQFSLFPKLLATLPPLRTALDVGCGPGAYCALLASRGFEVMGIDYAPAVIEIAKRKNSGITFAVASGYDLPYPDRSFDLVISIGALQCLEDYHRFVGELCRVAGKAVILSTLRRAYHMAPEEELSHKLRHDSWPTRTFHPDDLIPILADQGFTVTMHDTLEGRRLTESFFLVATR